MQTSAGRTSEAHIHQKKQMQNHKKRSREKSIHFTQKYHGRRPKFKNSSLKTAGLQIFTGTRKQQRKEAGIDNVRYFWDWDLNGNSKGCILGPRQLHQIRKLPPILVLLWKAKITFSVQFFPLWNMWYGWSPSYSMTHSLWTAQAILQQTCHIREASKMYVKITPRRNSAVHLCYCVPLNLSPLKLQVQCQIINIVKAHKTQS